MLWLVLLLTKRLGLYRGAKGRTRDGGITLHDIPTMYVLDNVAFALMHIDNGSTEYAHHGFCRRRGTGGAWRISVSACMSVATISTWMSTTCATERSAACNTGAK